ERLAGVAQGAASDPDHLLGQLQNEVRGGAGMIRKLSTAERGKKGINNSRGEMTVADVIESFVVGHAEEHLSQVQAALRKTRARSAGSRRSAAASAAAEDDRSVEVDHRGPAPERRPQRRRAARISRSSALTATAGRYGGRRTARSRAASMRRRSSSL